MPEEPDPREQAKELIARAAAEFECPRCHNVGFDVHWKLVARKLGTFSLSGTQMKFSANEIPVITCRGCGVTVEANTGA